MSAAAREFNVPEQRFRARWNGQRSEQGVVSWNAKLKEHEELVVCTYLDRLDKTGLHARLFMIADCANTVLRRAHVEDGPLIPRSAELHLQPEIQANRHPFSLPFARLD